jgi:hydrogenase nickel incorporation protein HypA/HybF
MHELSIALSIIEAAEQEAKRHEGKVSAVHVKVGQLSGVVADALQSSFEIARCDTPLAGSRLVIQEVPVIIYCSRCARQQTLDSNLWLFCPECGTPPSQFLQGKELELVSLELQ